MKLDCTCEYCQRNTYLWVLKNGIVWVEIPKNGSYNLKQFRLQFASHLPIENQPNTLIQKIDSIDVNQHKRGFVILRNPIDRFKSLLSHYFISGSRAGSGRAWLHNNNIAMNPTSQNITDIVLDNWDKIGNIGEPHHFNSQTSFIPKEFFEIPHMIYDVSELSLMFGLQQGVNSSGSNNILVSEENLKRIIDIYKDDIELYQKYFNISL